MLPNLDKWTDTGIIASGGTVSVIAGDQPLWLATEAGIFRRDEETGWEPCVQGQPLPQISAMAATGQTIVVGNGLGDIVFTRNGGEQWFRSEIHQDSSPITWLLLAPDFEESGVALAGTDGAGVLRTTNACKNWQPANFGLHDFNVLMMATPQSWGRREIVFAATTQAVYRSSNGGRAWKRSDSGLEPAVVQALALSPAYEEDRTLFAGTEAHGIYRSTNAGKNWEPINQGIPAGSTTTLPPVNALWLNPEFSQKPECVAACGDGQLLFFSNKENSWRQTFQTDTAILSLNGTPGQLHAGLYKNGLLSSVDGGRSWQPTTDLAVQALTRLYRAKDMVTSYGPTGQIWRTSTGEQYWQRIAFPDDTPLLTLSAVHTADTAFLLAATPNGVIRTAAEQHHWAPVLDGETPLVIHIPSNFTGGQPIWLGTSSGQVFISTDDGHNWSPVSAPHPGQPVVAIDKPTEELLIVATYATNNQQLTLWQSGDNGATWQQWHQAITQWPSVQLVWADDKALVCIGKQCWLSGATGWEEILETEQPILRLVKNPDTGHLILLTSRQLFISTSDHQWELWDEGLPSHQFLDMLIEPKTGQGQGVITILTTGGKIWQRSTPS
jgi:photosystem II stability/assembly factor-like uncharacterized protein